MLGDLRGLEQSDKSAGELGVVTLSQSLVWDVFDYILLFSSPLSASAGLLSYVTVLFCRKRDDILN